MAWALSREGGTGSMNTLEAILSKPLADLLAKPLGVRKLRGLGDDADNRLRVARPHVEPAVRPVQAEAVEPVYFRLRPVPGHRLVKPRQPVGGQRVLVLDDVIDRHLAYQLA